MSVACSASNGGAPACRISSARATASSSAPRREREPRAEHAHRPFVPAAGLAAVGAVGVAGAAEEFARRVVAGRASDESARACRRRRRSSRGTESGCGRRARGAALPRRASRSPSRTQIWPSVAERHGQAVARAVRFVQRRRCARRARAPARSGAAASSRSPGCRTPSRARRRR